MAYTEAYKEHIEISFEYLTEEKFCPLSTSDIFHSTLRRIPPPLQYAVRQLSSSMGSRKPWANVHRG